MALALVKKGIPVTLIEQLPDAAEDQRAATIHPPTVEMLVGLGLKTEMFSELPSGGMPAPLFHFRDRVTSELVAEFDISLLEGEVPYPYVVQWEQYKLVHAALPHIKANGIGEVRFSTKLVGLAQTSDGVEATVINAGGDTEKLCGKYLIGADGGSSTVRRLAEIAFVGFTWPERFIKIGTSFDFGATGRRYCTRNYFSDPDEWINLFQSKVADRLVSGAAFSRCLRRRPMSKRCVLRAFNAVCKGFMRRTAITIFPIMHSTRYISV